MTRARDYYGPYRLARLIRAGHSSEVWEAVKEAEQTRYALKILTRDQERNAAEVNALKQEFEIGKNLKHPNIIRLYEFVRDASGTFLVMELFAALNLKIVLRGGIQSVAHLVPNIIAQSADGLFNMHSEGFVHCDVKPDNFLVSEDGTVKLIDFAISRPIKSGIMDTLNPMNWLFRRIQGTRSYMSPEQIRGQHLDARADIYSFGCVLFELVGGKTPFTGDSADDLLKKHLSAQIPSVQALNNNVTADFAALIRRMMAKKKEDRPQTMWEFQKELRAIQVFKVVPRSPEMRRLRIEDYEKEATLVKRDKTKFD